MQRKQILDEATRIVCGGRSYGEPENNFGTIGALWETYLRWKTGADVQIESKDVAVMMILLKIARINTGEIKADNWIDIAGYAACGAEVDVV